MFIDRKRIAGTNVSTGNFTKKYKYKIIRDGKVIGKNLELSNLKHHKAEVSEIKGGQECGITFFEYLDYEKGDRVEGYEPKGKKKN